MLDVVLSINSYDIKADIALPVVGYDIMLGTFGDRSLLIGGDKCLWVAKLG